jgi:general secretion pathway protein A
VDPLDPGARRSLLDLFPPAAVDRARAPRPLSTVNAPAPMREAPAAGLTYEAFYGLQEEPFSLSTDPRFVYHSAAHDRTAQELLTAIRRREGLVQIIGPIGIGKTMLCRAVIEELDRRTFTSFLVDPFRSVEDLLQTILIDFGVISREDLQNAALPPTPDDLRSTLRSFFVSLGSLQANAVVIIDEAQNLPVSVLDELAALADSANGARLMQVVLVGQPTLAAQRRRPDLRPLNDLITVRSELGPLAADEIAGYVVHRLAVAGSSSGVEFDDEALKRVFELSGGVPRLVNVLCDRALSRGFQQSARVITGPLVDGAAEELDLAPPVPAGPDAMHTIVGIVALIALVLVGAAAAAWVFQGPLQRALVQWEAVPPPPAEPTLRLPAALAPLPPPAASVNSIDAIR